ncbi:MAG: virulence-associated E family protein [Bacteroidales bacterium]|nr:virulence-associated E family protein [Bacteroidales bacterium]
MQEYKISIGKSRQDTRWKVKEVSWEWLAQRLSETHRTAETTADYKKASRDRKGEIKDIGGFVGGAVIGGRRKKDSVPKRGILTLDIDYGDDAVWDEFTMEYDCAACIYSTHSHTPQNPRYRLIIPLSREVGADEYQAVGRKVAAVVGIDKFDDSTYQMERLMYWPSTPKDGEFYYDVQEGEPLDVESVLATYTDWRDVSQWEISSRVDSVIQRSAKKQGEPTEKPGAVGAFCRCYDIHEAIEIFLADVYTPTDVDGRYTFAGGSSSMGLVTYEDKFAYSHHATDPAGQQLCNAFDLVRIHKFADLDEDCAPGTPINRTASFKAMEKMAYEDGRVKAAKNAETMERVNAWIGDLDELETEADASGTTAASEDDADWLNDLETDKNGAPTKTIGNIVMVLEHAPGLKGNVMLNELSGHTDSPKRLPWRKIEGYAGQQWTDTDLSQFSAYLEGYGIKDCDTKAQHAVRIVASNHKYHPVRQYLNSLRWDGVERVNTLLHDYLGAADDHITQVMTRKTLAAAVARAYAPGTKFDQVLVLQGPEGCGKSEILKRLGRDWFNASITDISGKEGMQSIQGNWIIELGELVGIKRNEVEVVKGFITREVDEYRASYGKIKESHPRQCIMFATTNEGEFLKGDTGNRRFWVVRCKVSEHERAPWDLSREDIDQIWAEAVHIWKVAKEPLYLEDRADVEAVTRIQEEFNDANNDPRKGLIEVFLDKKLPADYLRMDGNQRFCYFADENRVERDGLIYRDRVCAMEILVECLGKRIDQITRYDVRDINSQMRQIAGWAATPNAYKDSMYGRVRGFYRIEPIEEDDEI